MAAGVVARRRPRSSARAAAQSGSLGVVTPRWAGSAPGGELYQSEREGSLVQVRLAVVAPLWYVGVVAWDLFQLLVPEVAG